jgi:hypothetical protein
MNVSFSHTPSEEREEEEELLPMPAFPPKEWHFSARVQKMIVHLQSIKVFLGSVWLPS